jgi:ABC-2 type transport system ATP-binding protein
MDTQEPVVVANALALATPYGPVFGPLTFEMPEKSIVALCGPSGSGATAALLCLSGRMRPTAGRARVCGLDVRTKASRVRSLTGLGIVRGVNDLDEALTCEDHVAERRLFTPSPPDDVLARVGLSHFARRRVRSLSAEQRMRLGIALALVGSPHLIAIDDLDRELTAEQAARVSELLREVADDGVAALVACLDPASAAFADTIVALAEPSEGQVAPDALA